MFLLETELQYLKHLKAAGVPLNEYSVPKEKVANIQSQLERLMEKNYYLYQSARDAYRGYVLSYQSHKLKGCYDVFKLDLQRVAKSFGFSGTRVCSGKHPCGCASHPLAPQHRPRSIWASNPILKALRLLRSTTSPPQPMLARAGAALETVLCAGTRARLTRASGPSEQRRFFFGHYCMRGLLRVYSSSPVRCFGRSLAYRAPMDVDEDIAAIPARLAVVRREIAEVRPPGVGCLASSPPPHPRRAGKITSPCAWLQ